MAEQKVILVYRPVVGELERARSDGDQVFERYFLFHHGHLRGGDAEIEIFRMSRCVRGLGFSPPLTAVLPVDDREVSLFPDQAGCVALPPNVPWLLAPVLGPRATSPASRGPVERVPR